MSRKRKAARDTMRKHVDVMEMAKAGAETMQTWIARCEVWSRQVDEYYECELFNKKQSHKQNMARFEEYTGLQRNLHSWKAESVDRGLRCYGVGKDNISLLAQMTVAGMSGVVPKTNELASDQPRFKDGTPTDPAGNETMKLLTASFADKCIRFKMPHPDLQIPGVPDEEPMATPREQIQKQMDGILPGGGKKTQ